MADDLFVGLPPPSSASAPTVAEQGSAFSIKKDPLPASTPARVPAPAPALKSALKRDKPPETPAEVEPQKRIRFKTTTDATEAQVLEAMRKIASHIKNPSKFSKASKLALQLIQAGSVRAGTSDHFFAILEAAMSSQFACAEPSLRAEYQALFSAAQDVVEHFTKQQKNQFATWTLRAVVANDLYTDDSFVFSRAAGKIKEAISSLPLATEDDEIEDAAAHSADADNAATDMMGEDTKSSDPADSTKQDTDASDPFGLDSLLSVTSGKGGKVKGKKQPFNAKQKEDEEHARFLRLQREALTFCLEIAARRYKTPWAQTVIDILAKHALDNIERFTSRQRDAVEKLWASIREQHIRRKQGKSVSGKLDVTAFEWLQEKYSHEKISIRHSVGGGGDHKAEQWLG